MSVSPIDQRFLDSEPRINTTAKLHGCKLGRFTEIGERVILRDVTVGDFSYFERNGEAIYTDVGRFCSIASNVRLNALEHPMERASTHKMTYRPNEYFRFMTLDSAFRERRHSKRVVIGHDVWVGHGAVIMPDIAIGHGAVIGANAVVTKDVIPYEIVGGVPARHIRMRFPDDIIQQLLDLSWWNWPLNIIYEAIPDMQQLSIKQFIAKWK
ncbi:chloramphenicol acetyltransferase [uncultured Bartonella sp.]|uniref:chloramphenicol acetyltransferase n=1 Tax=uncultured Bartonella sp. TaxID=104108 RepID=UPI002606219A|nr:chloramphenicol acetyltransferase [uncultured Bartonella sp.]